MKNYLCVQNNGLICKEDMLFMGSSSKRDRDGKIGKFGSGWKYAIPTLIRNGIDLKVFSGHNEIEITTRMVTHRDNLVELIFIDGENTNNVTQLGPDWTPWMAMREIISNAIDEGGHKQLSCFIDDSNQFPTQDGITSVYIQITNEVANIIRDYEKYFSFERKEFYKCSTARVFIKSEPSETSIYRMGIRCYDHFEDSRFDFDFTNIPINESRLTTSNDIKRNLKEIFKEPDLPRSILEIAINDHFTSWLPDNPSDRIMEILTEMINEGVKFTTSTINSLLGIMGSGSDTCIPSEWFSRLVNLGLVQSPFDKMLKNNNIHFIETFHKPHDFDEAALKYCFRNIGITISKVRYGSLSDSESRYTNGEILIDVRSIRKPSDIFIETIYRFGREEIKMMLPEGVE